MTGDIAVVSRHYRPSLWSYLELEKTNSCVWMGFQSPWTASFNKSSIGELGIRIMSFDGVLGFDWRPGYGSTHSHRSHIRIGSFLWGRDMHLSALSPIGAPQM